MPEQPAAELRRPRSLGRMPGRIPAAADFLMLSTMYSPPRLPRRPILRGRLVTQLDDGVRETPLTLVSAPAGSGKTTLAATWLEHPGVPWRVVWLTLSEATGSPAEFWFFVTEALSRAGLELPHTTSLPSGPPAGDAFVTQLAADLLNRSEPVVLVLDEVERIGDNEVLRQLDLLLRLAAVRIRLVLLTRVDPLLPMQRYRLTGTMTQIRMADLAFTMDESRALLSSSGLDLSEQTVEALQARTQGWAAGLQLVALAQEHRPAEREVGAPEWLPGAQDANLAEYLTGEILGAQSEHLRDFLLRTSVVDLLSVELAEALTEEAGAAISLVTLVHHNILMEAVGDVPGCYHAHPLFRELLRAQLAYESPELLPELHARAGRWFAEAGLVGEAVSHLTAAGRWDEVARLVVDGMLVGELLRPSAGGLAHRIAGTPPAATGVGAAVVRAAVAIGRSELQVCDESLDRVEEQAPPGADLRLDVAVWATRLAAAAAHGDHEQAQAAASRLEAALRDLRRDGAADAEPAVQADDLWSLLLPIRGLVELHRGDLDAASASLSAGVTSCVAAGLGAEQVANLGRSALTEALLGRLQHARELVDAAEKLLEEQAGSPDAPLPAALALASAWTDVEAGLPGPARSTLAAPRLPPDPLERVVVTTLEAVLRSRIHRAMAGGPNAPEPREPVGPVPGWLEDLLAQERVALHLAAGRQVEAGRVAARVPGPRSVRAEVTAARADLALGEGTAAGRLDAAARERRDGVPLDVQLDAWLLEVQSRLEAGHRDQAVAAARRAIRLGRPEALRRPFHDAPDDVRRLWGSDARLADVARWLSDGVVRPSRTTVLPVPRRHGDGDEQPIIVDALSARETEVLRHLADLLTTEEVAEAMFVSVNTVKSHIRSILRKLSVARRNEAIRRARELHVI